MKNKLVILSLLFAITCSGQVYSGNNPGNSFTNNDINNYSFAGYPKTSVNEQTYDIFGKYKNRLPYKFSQSEIEKVKDENQMRILQKWYILVKYTFNILAKKIEEVEKCYNAKDDDKKLVENCIQIITNYLTNEKEDAEKTFSKATFDSEKITNLNITLSEIEKFFDSACHDGLGSIYLRDIVRPNIYAAMISYWVKKNNDTLDNKNADKNGYSNKVRKNNYSILKEIKNDRRKKITNDLLDRYYLHKELPLLSLKNDKAYGEVIDYDKYLIRIGGVQQDIYNNFANNLFVLGMDFKTYKLIDDINMNVIGHKERIQIEFHNFVLEGFVTDPDIIDDVENYSPNISFDDYKDTYKIIE